MRAGRRDKSGLYSPDALQAGVRKGAGCLECGGEVPKEMAERVLEKVPVAFKDVLER